MIQISEQAREYIQRKGGAVHLLQNPYMSMCCGRMNLGPSVRVGKPKDTEAYTLLAVDGSSVYLPPDFYSPYELTISLNSILGFKSLVVEGWKLV